MTIPFLGPALIQHLDRKTSTYCRVHIEKGTLYYKTAHGAFSFKGMLPCKQSFTGWLSPEGFLFGCVVVDRGLSFQPAYDKAAEEILLALAVEPLSISNPVKELQDRGWVFLSHSYLFDYRENPNDIQIQVIEALRGVKLDYD